MHSLCRRLVLVLLIALALPARADDAAATRAANAHADKGRKAFEAGRYPEAIDELRAALILTGQPRYMYALGQAYRLNHQCMEAVQVYRDFLRANPSRDQIAATEECLRLCGKEDPRSIAAIASSSPPVAPPPPVVQEPVAPPTPVTVAPTITAPPPPPPRRPAYKKWWVWTTVGIVVAAGVGVGLGVGLTHHEYKPDITFTQQ